MKKLILASLVTILIGFLSTMNTQNFNSLTLGDNNLQANHPQTVPHVDLQRFMGVWHEISSIPAWFEHGCEKTISDFEMSTDGTIKVDNVCYTKEGKKHEGAGKAFPDPKDAEHSNAKLKLKMPPYPGEGDFWVVRLDESYSYMVASSPDYHYLWVYYRSPVMPESLYQSIYESLEKDGYHVEKLKKTIQ